MVNDGKNCDRLDRVPEEKDLTANSCHQSKEEENEHTNTETVVEETESMCSMSELSTGSPRVTIMTTAQEVLRRQFVPPNQLSKRQVYTPDDHCQLNQKPSLELFVTSPDGPPSCVGVYELALDRKANGHPCWRHVDDSHWLFSSIEGRWIIGGPDLNFDEFWRINGILSQGTLHGGHMPYVQGAAWRRWTGDRIVEDRTINVTIHKAAILPTEICLTAPDGCEYAKKHDSHPRVAGDLNEPPTEVVESRDGDSRVSGDLNEPSTEVVESRDGDSQGSIMESSRKPGEVLQLISPSQHKVCEGEYCLVADTVVNGHPLYQLKEGKRWLYTGLDGRWYVGGYHAKTKDFACSSGYIVQKQPHDGKLPHELEGHWRWGDSCNWHEDPAIRVIDTASVAKHASDAATH